MSPLTPAVMHVLDQKYGHQIRVQVYASQGDFLQLHVQHATDRPKDLICVTLFSHKMARGTQYHIYEMVHSVFDPH